MHNIYLNYSTQSCNMLYACHTGVHGHVCFMYTTLEYMVMCASCTLHWSTWSCMLHVHYTVVHNHVCFMYTTLEYTYMIMYVSCTLHWST